MVKSSLFDYSRRFIIIIIHISLLVVVSEVTKEEEEKEKEKVQITIPNEITKQCDEELTIVVGSQYVVVVGSQSSVSTMRVSGCAYSARSEGVSLARKGTATRRVFPRRESTP